MRSMAVAAAGTPVVAVIIAMVTTPGTAVVAWRVRPMKPIVRPLITDPEIGVTAVSVVMHVQTIRELADCESRRHAPEATRIMRFAGPIGIVIDRIASRVVMIRRNGLRVDHLRRFVIGYIGRAVVA